MKYKLTFIIGTRPDIIRCSKLIELLDNNPKIDLTLIHTGQHYDSNLSDSFFKELNIRKPDIVLSTGGVSPCQQHSKLISQLEPVLIKLNPDACMFIGDTNAVIGCIVPLRLNIPIIHCEAGMRAYNWDMIEERNRVLIDNVSDVLYVYQDDYKVQLVQEGIDPTKIVVTGNIIVDIIEEHIREFDWRGDDSSPYGFKSIQGVNIECSDYALMTLHRDEHMRDPKLSQKIIDQVGRATSRRNLSVVLIEMPRLKALRLEYPANFIISPPLGYFEFGMLEANAAIEYTDSGTNQESASLFSVPCVVTRVCTERPECRDCGTTVLSGYSRIEEATELVLSAQYNPNFSLGDGKSSQRIVDDLIERFDNNFCNKNSFKYRHFAQL